MKPVFTTATLIAASTMLATAHAETLYLDFGSSSSTGTANEVTYNDIHIEGNVIRTVAEVPLQLNGAATGTTAPITLAYTNGASSGIGFEIDMINTAGSIGDNNTEFAGPYPAALSGIEASALRSHFFLNRGGDVAFKLSGLDDSKTYNIVVYGGSAQVGNANNSIIDFDPLVGTGVDYVSKSMNTFNNQTEVLSWTGISSVAGGIEFIVDDNGNTGNGNPEGWLNFMSIEEVVPEPGSLALIGVGGLMVLRRRR